MYFRQKYLDILDYLRDIYILVYPNFEENLKNDSLEEVIKSNYKSYKNAYFFHQLDMGRYYVFVQRENINVFICVLSAIISIRYGKVPKG